MLDASTQGGTAGLLDHLSRPIPTEPKPLVEKPRSLHPLDDPARWAHNPPYAPPSDVDIAYEQKQIDSIYGTTRGNESIFKLVWAGDRDYWYEFFTEWDGVGRPTKAVEKYPRIRYKILRDSRGKKIRDVFPPRWLLLTRIEKEQYADVWKDESFIFAPEIGCKKQIRPSEPPPVFWLWFMTIAHHTDHCCGIARKNKKVCYGTYARPGACHETLYQQKQADQQFGMHSPFERVEYDMIQDVEDQNTGYRFELSQLQAEANILKAHPMAALGIAGAETLENNAGKIDAFLDEHFDREIDRVGGKV